MNNSKHVLEHMCRACMDKNQNAHSIYDNSVDGFTICEVLVTSIPQLFIYKNDALPKKICQPCLNTLMIVDKFQQMCVYSDTHMRNLLARSSRLRSYSNNEEQQQQAVYHAEMPQKTTELDENLPEVKKVVTLKTVEGNHNEDIVDSDWSDTDNEPLITSGKSKRNALESEETQNYVKIEVGNEEVQECNLKIFLDSKIMNIKTEAIEYKDEIPTELDTVNNRYSQEKSLLNVVRAEYQLPRQSSIGKEKEVHEIEKPNSLFNRKYNFQCLNCGVAFNSKFKLKCHARVHLESRHFVCEICNYRFENRGALLQHKHSHKIPPPGGYKCSKCPRRFEKLASLQRHSGSHYKLIVCEHCSEGFASKYRLYTHHCKESFSCPQCDKILRNQQFLTEHLKRHTGEKRYRCSECPSCFELKKNLAKHMKSHVGLKPYSCNICGLSYTRSFSLKRHKIVIHTPYTRELKHKCDKCEMMFSYKYLMKRHLRKVHSNYKPFKCNQCEKAFAFNGERNKHMREHIGEKAYICAECSKAFKYQKELHKHLANHYKQ